MPFWHKAGLMTQRESMEYDFVILASDTYGGGFLYPLGRNQELQRYKTHAAIRAFLGGGKRVAYGAT